MLCTQASQFPIGVLIFVCVESQKKGQTKVIIISLLLKPQQQSNKQTNKQTNE
jgi:hypothetical protein